MFIRRWDRPTHLRQFQIPSARAAEQLLEELQTAAAPRSPGVIEHVLRAFRYVRRNVVDTVDSLQVLNGLLLAAREVALGGLPDNELRQCETIDDVFNLLSQELQKAGGVDRLSRSVRQLSARQMIPFLLDPDQENGYALRADLLFRHAASQLYQEAHLDIERNQGVLFAMGESAPSGRGPRDVRYTPANLARALVQQAIKRYPKTCVRAEPLVVLDPACGSGIFLQEFVREWAVSWNSGPLHLIGIDQSRISKCIADSSLHLSFVELDRPQNLKIQVDEADALEVHWPSSDIILMNPPFRSWPDMERVQQARVVDILGDDLTSGRPDLAMAFIWKAFQSLKEGGVLAAVLPGALLENQSGYALREALGSQSELLMIGRFEGFSYFSSSLVETAFFVLRRKAPEIATQRTEVLIAAEKAEDRALRVLRGAKPPDESERAFVELFDAPLKTFRAGSWLPRRQADLRFLELLDSRELPKVSDLFAVHQGIRTGHKAAFLLSAEDLQKLPKRERKYFRPAAGQGTIRDGQLFREEYVFYPYAPAGVVLTNETLVREVPRYHEMWLLPLKEKLAHRAKITEWWLPTWPRSWQFEPQRKLVSTYFGGRGSFAFDETGEYAVVEGFAWLWKKGVQTPGAPDDERDGDPLAFEETTLPLAYLALLNSNVFVRAIACYSWRLQGGQMRLESRFLDDIPMPNVNNQERVSMQLVERLVGLGKKIMEGHLDNVQDQVDGAAADAYELPG